MPKKARPSSREVVRVARRGDLSHAEVGADSDISVEPMLRWVRQGGVTTVSDLAAEGIPVRLTCGVLGHSKQAYAVLAAPGSQREPEDENSSSPKAVAVAA